jgi:hypothetical protein
MKPKHDKLKITSFTCLIIDKTNLACEALDVTCLELKTVHFEDITVKMYICFS